MTLTSVDRRPGRTRFGSVPFGIWRPPLTAVLVSACIANLIAQVPRALRDVADTDFLPFISASRVLSTGSSALYSLSRLHASESAFLQRALPPGQTASFLNPPLTAVVLLPLVALPAALALALFLLLLLAALAGASALLARLLRHHTRGTRTAVLVTSVASFPAASSIALGQWDALVVLACAGAIVAAQRGRTLSAGLLLGIALVKPQLVLLLPVVLLVSGHRRVLAGFLLAGVGWMVGSLILVGPVGLSAWLKLTASVSGAELHRSVSLPGAVTAVSTMPTLGLAVDVVCVALAVAALWKFRSMLNADIAGATGLAICLSELCGLHLFPDDLMLLAIPLIAVARSRPAVALGAALSLSAAFIVDPVLPPRLQVLETAVLAGILMLQTLALWHLDRVSDVGGEPAGGRSCPVKSDSVGLREPTVAAST